MKNFKYILSALVLLCTLTFTNAQSTYTIGSTEYVTGQYYTTTGKPKVVRSATNKKKFLKSAGYNTTPYGYEIDHITPLSEGGSDDPSNMQLLTIRQHKVKTARERARRSTSTFSSYPKYTTSKTFTTTNNYYPTQTNSSKSIYTGRNGGKYYFNSNGNKVYVKAKKKQTSYNYNFSAPSYSVQSYSVPSYSTSSSSSRVIQTGSRGGKYYINSNGNKTYVKKN